MEISTEHKISAFYHMYDLIDDRNTKGGKEIYPPSLFGKWFYFEEKQKNTVNSETYNRLVQVDEDAYYNCYRKIFNPVSVKLWGPIGSVYNPTLIAVCTVGLCTIDDSYYGGVFTDLSRQDFDDIIEKIDVYLNEHLYLNHLDFVNFLISLGAEDNSY